MGCDIHLFAEAKTKKTLIQKLLFWRKAKWESIDKWEWDNDYEPPRLLVPYGKRFYNGGRNYNLFAALCGVRGFHFNEYTSVSEPKGLPVDVSEIINNESDLWGTDGHSHNWNTLSELKAFDWSGYGETVDDFLNEVIPKMEKYNPDEVRIVYWFDN